jgi:hypothetical protein
VELTAIDGLADGSSVVATGFVVADSGVVVLSEFLAESFPPQPAGAMVELRGLDVDAVEGLQTAGPVRWTPTPVTVRATVEGGQLIGAEARAEQADDRAGHGDTPLG